MPVQPLAKASTLTNWGSGSEGWTPKNVETAAHWERPGGLHLATCVEGSSQPPAARAHCGARGHRHRGGQHHPCCLSTLSSCSMRHAQVDEEGVSIRRRPPNGEERQAYVVVACT